LAVASAPAWVAKAAAAARTLIATARARKPARRWRVALTIGYFGHEQQSDPSRDGSADGQDTRSKPASVLAARLTLRERRVEPVPRLSDLANYLRIEERELEAARAELTTWSLLLRDPYRTGESRSYTANVRPRRDSSVLLRSSSPSEADTSILRTTIASSSRARRRRVSTRSLSSFPVNLISSTGFLVLVAVMPSLLVRARRGMGLSHVAPHR